jgi:acyl-CoA hydrolase
MEDNKISFQFISEPTDVNFGGKVHGGVVMKWIDQAAFTCARTWSGTYCVTVYVGGIRFLKPVSIGDIVKVDASIIHTGNSSIHIAVDVYSRDIKHTDFQKTTHCVIVFVSVDEDGKPQPVRAWEPITDKQKKFSQYAQRLNELRTTISDEMKPFF